MISTGKLNYVNSIMEVIGGRVILQDYDLCGAELCGQGPIEAILHVVREGILTRIWLPIDDQWRVNQDQSWMWLGDTLAVFEQSEVEGSMCDGANTLAVARPPLARDYHVLVLLAECHAPQAWEMPAP